MLAHDLLLDGAQSRVRSLVIVADLIPARRFGEIAAQEPDDERAKRSHDEQPAPSGNREKRRLDDEPADETRHRYAEKAQRVRPGRIATTYRSRDHLAYISVGQRRLCSQPQPAQEAENDDPEEAGAKAAMSEQRE